MMRTPRSLVIAALALAVLAGAASRASAASSYDSCVGFIDVLPTVISTPGRWCLRQHLITNFTTNNAIEVRTNNVTIDCNGFTLDNRAAGRGTASAGMLAWGFSNIRVRNCTIEGFFYGTFISGDLAADNHPPLQSGHVVENNRFSQNRYAGIHVDGFANVIRGNIVTNTGGALNWGGGVGIVAWAPVDVIDNIVDGVFGASESPNWGNVGILAGALDLTVAAGFQVRGNRVRNLGQKGNFLPQGLKVIGYGVIVEDNLLAQRDPTPGQGLYCLGVPVSIRNNIIKNYSQAIYGICDDQGGNIAY